MSYLITEIVKNALQEFSKGNHSSLHEWFDFDSNPNRLDTFPDNSLLVLVSNNTRYELESGDIVELTSGACVSKLPKSFSNSNSEDSGCSLSVEFKPTSKSNTGKNAINFISNKQLKEIEGLFLPLSALVISGEKIINNINNSLLLKDTGSSPYADNYIKLLGMLISPYRLDNSIPLIFKKVNKLELLFTEAHEYPTHRNKADIRYVHRLLKDGRPEVRIQTYDPSKNKWTISQMVRDINCDDNNEYELSFNHLEQGDQHYLNRSKGVLECYFSTHEKNDFLEILFKESPTLLISKGIVTPKYLAYYLIQILSHEQLKELISAYRENYLNEKFILELLPKKLPMFRLLVSSDKSNAVKTSSLFS